MLLENTYSGYRIWTDLQTVGGQTLRLGPGEIGDVAVDEIPVDPYLRPVGAAKSGRRRKATGEPVEAVSGLGAGPQTPSGGDDPPDKPTNEPAEADASGKEA